MNRLQPVQEVTEQLATLLKQEVHAANRELVIEQATELIEKRGEHMTALEPPFTEEELAAGRALIPVNTLIEKRMNELFESLKLEMKQLKQQKKSNRQYQNPYKDVAAMDGTYVDSKN